MSYPALVRRLAPQPFACEPHTLAAIRTLLWRKAQGESFTGAEAHRVTGRPVRADLEAATQRQREQARAGGIAVIPVYGTIDQRPSSFGASVEEVDAMFTAAMHTKAVEAILLDVDSPGGVVSGVPELAEKIAAARGVKPVLALANSLAASAGYWLAAAASEVWVTPSGEAGSIGIWTLHEDLTEHLRQEGVVVTEFAAGEFKTEGAPWKPLSDEARAVLQARVDEAYTWFVRDVARFRGDTPANVRAGYGRGRVLSATDAKREKLVDKIGTFEEAVGRLTKLTTRRGQRADLLRERLALDDAGRAA